VIPTPPVTSGGFPTRPSPWPIAQIVLQHHEREDGPGCPMGASSSQILIEAEIIAVAEVVEKGSFQLKDE